MNTMIARLRLRLTMLAVDEAGMSTVEYAIGTIVICVSASV